MPDRRGLPWMGLGLSSNLSARNRPHPYRLLEIAPGAFDYVEYSAPLDLDEARRSASLFATLWERRDEVPVLFHPVHLNLYGPALEAPRALEALARHLEAVGAPWVSNDVGWWHVEERFFPGHLYLAPPLSRAGLEDCVAHVAHVQAHLPVPLLIENPAIIARRGPLHVLEFMAELHARTGAELLLDLGHLLSHQLACGLPLDAGLRDFPLERVVEIHLAGGVVTARGGRQVYVDDHPQPVREELFALLEVLVPACPRLRAVTYEADGHPEAIALPTLERLRRLVPPAGARPEEPAAAPCAAPERLVAASRPWAVFEEAYGAGEAAEDPEGARAERAFRLAALAERVDRVFPFSRLLLAGSGEGLGAFAASPEFREGFGACPRDATESFARWARRRLREMPDEPVATVLAFESWALERAQEAGARAAGKGGEEAGVVVARFPLDLSELLWAAAALRRHLAGRAETSGVFEASGLAALRQVAARARPGPWRVAVRRRGGRVEVSPLAGS